MNKSRVSKYIKLYKKIPFKWLVWKGNITKQSISNYKNHRRTGEKMAATIEKNIEEAIAFMREYDSLTFRMDDKLRISTDSLYLALNYCEIYPELSNSEAYALCKKKYDEAPVNFKVMLTKFLIKQLN